jgi:ABC-type uncharacterized transport system permease subunit
MVNITTKTAVFTYVCFLPSSHRVSNVLVFCYSTHLLWLIRSNGYPQTLIGEYYYQKVAVLHLDSMLQYKLIILNTIMACCISNLFGQYHLNVE